MNKKKNSGTATNGYQKNIHKRMANEYIQYVCEQATKEQLRAAEICLVKLPNGKYLTKQDVESYARENNHTIEGTFSIAGKESLVKMHLCSSAKN